MGAPPKKVPSVSSNACPRTSSNQSSSTNSAWSTPLPPLDAQERQNIQMLYGLGHNAFVRGDDQHGKVNAPAPASIF